MASNTTLQNYSKQYKKEEIYTSKTVIKYDEYGNVISKDVYYDKEIKYADRTNNLHTIQPMINTYHPHNQYHNQSYQSQDISSTHTSPSSSVPSSPTSPNSVSIDMSNMSMYNY